MKAKLFLVMLSLGAVVLSGCIFEPVDEPDPSASTGDTDSDGAGPTDANDTAEPDPEPAPVVVDVSLTASNVTGEAPFNVVFNLSSDSARAQWLDWSFDANGDGNEDKTGYGLPAEVPFTFEEPGNFTAAVTVTDVEGNTGDATLAIQVVAPPTIIVPDPITFNGTITGLSDNVDGYLIGGPVEHEFNLTVPVNNITITFETGETAVDLDFVLYRPDGEQADEKASFNEPTGLAYRSTESPMLIEDREHLDVFGTWVLVVHPYISIEGEYSVTVSFA